MNNNPESLLQAFSELSRKPHEFLSVQNETAQKIKVFLKQIYDFTKLSEDQKYKNTLPELIVEKFDEEQIWQEIELQNTTISNELVQTFPQLSVKRDKLKFPVKLKCNKDEDIEAKTSSEPEKEEFDETEDLGSGDELFEDGEEENYDEEYENESDISEDESDNEQRKIIKKGKVKPSVVDDQFFKLNELEQFLQNEEKHLDKPEKEHHTLDLFDKMDNEATDYKYSDFFEDPDNEETSEKSGKQKSKNKDEEDEDFFGEDQDIEDFDEEDEQNSSEEKPSKRKLDETEEADSKSDEDQEDSKPKSKKVRFNLLGSGDENDSEEEGSFANSKKSMKSDEVKSSLELRQERLSKVIGRLEDEALSEKPWQLKGEVSANLRPENSLLEEAVDFDLSVRPAPVMTGEVTMKLEDIIIQRIKDKAWDDVEKKVKPVDTPAEFKKKLTLDQEKSKLSLAEVYEQEFVKQREAATADDTERQEVEPALHVEVRGMLTSLFNKLDALSNYHYTPRPVVPEMKVVSNVAAINMEEVAPVTMADSALLAPQEIKGKKRATALMSKEERTDTDKKRARRLKKTKQRQRQREKEKAAKEISKLNPGLGNKYSKLKVEKQLKDASSSNIIKMDEKQDKVIKGSTSFFNKLQDEVKSQITSKSSPFAKKKDKRLITAKKLKL